MVNTVQFIHTCEHVLHTFFDTVKSRGKIVL